MKSIKDIVNQEITEMKDKQGEEWWREYFNNFAFNFFN